MVDDASTAEAPHLQVIEHPNFGARKTFLPLQGQLEEYRNILPQTNIIIVRKIVIVRKVIVMIIVMIFLTKMTLLHLSLIHI